MTQNATQVKKIRFFTVGVSFWLSSYYSLSPTIKQSNRERVKENRGKRKSKRLYKECTPWILPFNILQKGTPLLVKLVKFSILNPKLELLCQPQMLWSIFLGTSLTFPKVSSIPIIRQNTKRWVNQDLKPITHDIIPKPEERKNTPFTYHLETLIILPTVT